ncbi:MAG: carbohydrate ABC transporter permease [Clostridiales bacterium]|nr:carbohydrate ABC transporter permease [Clostridiales bacterium]
MKKDDIDRVGFIQPIELKTFKGKTTYIMILVFMLLFSLIFIVPLCWMLLSAFKDTQEFLQIPPSLLPKKISLEKVKEVWTFANMGRTYICTLFMTAVAVLTMLISNGLAGYVLSRLKPKGSAVVKTIVLWTMMVPSTLSIAPKFMTFVDMPLIHVNLSNTYWPMWIMAGASAYYTLLFKNFFDGISSSLIEAAEVDGCSKLSIFFKIVLPLSKPIMITVAIFGIMGNWGTFFWPYLMIKDIELQPIGVRVFMLKEQLSVDRHLMVLVFAMIPPMIVFLFLQKRILGGLSGGVKG